MWKPKVAAALALPQVPRITRPGFPPAGPDPTLYYYSAMNVVYSTRAADATSRPLSYAQWQSLGFAAPDSTSGTATAPDYRCTPSEPKPWQ